MSSRIGLRLLSRNTSLSTFRQQRTHLLRRYQQTAASSTSTATPAQPQSLLQRLWTSEVGVKTVHFWAPVMKWAIVLAGVSDFFRPAEKLSLTQNLALTATGSIWTRWCFIIKPKNYLLAAVNFCLAIVGMVQVSRIVALRSSRTGEVKEAVLVSKEEEKRAAEGVKKDMKRVVD